MKEMIMAAVLLVSSFCTTVQAGTGDKSAKAAKKDNVSNHVKESFNKQFPQAQYAVWEQLNQHELYVVRFVYNQEGIVAYVDMEGIVIATVRIIQKDKLPFTVNKVLESEYGNSEVKETLELVLNGELNYLITLENEKASVSLKVSANGHSSELKRQKIAKKAF